MFGNEAGRTRGKYPGRNQGSEKQAQRAVAFVTKQSTKGLTARHEFPVVFAIAPLPCGFRKKGCIVERHAG